MGLGRECLGGCDSPSLRTAKIDMGRKRDDDRLRRKDEHTCMDSSVGLNQASPWVCLKM